MLSRIGFAVGVVDFAVVGGLGFVICIRIGESAWVKSQKALMREEERSAQTFAQGQLESVVTIAIFHRAVAGPTFLVGGEVDGVGGTACCQNIGDEALVPTANGHVHFPSQRGAPMPV